MQSILATLAVFIVFAMTGISLDVFVAVSISIIMLSGIHKFF